MYFRFLSLLLFFVALPASGQEITLDAPNVVMRNTPFGVSVGGMPVDTTTAYALRLGGAEFPLVLDLETEAMSAEELRVPTLGRTDVEVVRSGEVIATGQTYVLPGWVSVLPPVIAIFIALLFKRVIPALFLGVWVGAWAANAFSLAGLWYGLLETFETYVLNAFVDEGHAAIILFSLMIGGMVGIISKSGGMQGVVNLIIGWAQTPRKGQIATGVLGLVVFFDDYANTLVVGNTMRSVTDRLKVSREKLAYIVDSTAAPVACLALVTTWIGYEVGLIGTAVDQIEGFDESAYSIFLNSIPYSFYPIFALFFVFSVANSRRDFGPMYDAEFRARTTGQVLGPDAKVDEAAAEGEELTPPEGKPQRAINALVPVLVLVVGVLVGLYVTGLEVAGPDASLQDIIGEADSYRSLMWASLIGVLVAGALAVGQRILTLEESIEAWYAGLKSMLFAMIILVLAWALSNITEVLYTANYLVAVLGDTLPYGLVPAIVFILAAATAFATGSSWGTMGILMPLVLPLTWAVMAANGLANGENLHIIYSTTSAVLAGAVWGDHCSPISDTTILSSMASGCDHIDHVRTQLPYALLTGFVAIFVGIIPSGYGFPWWLSMLIGFAILGGGLRVFGRRVADEIAERDDVTAVEREVPAKA